MFAGGKCPTLARNDTGMQSERSIITYLCR